MKLGLSTFGHDYFLDILVVKNYPIISVGQLGCIMLKPIFETPTMYDPK